MRGEDVLQVLVRDDLREPGDIRKHIYTRGVACSDHTPLHSSELVLWAAAATAAAVVVVVVMAAR